MNGNATLAYYYSNAVVEMINFDCLSTVREKRQSHGHALSSRLQGFCDLQFGHPPHTARPTTSESHHHPASTSISPQQ